MKMWMLILVAGLSLSVAGCDETETPNGEVPPEYMPVAQRYEGTYTGQMEGRAGSLTLSFNGNKAILTSSNDLAGGNCNSRIGQLKSFEAEEDDGDYFLEEATFAFDANNCVSIMGEEVVLTFKEKNGRMQISARILEETRFEEHCRFDPGNPVNGIPPREYCDQIPVSEYLTGKFTR